MSLCNGTEKVLVEMRQDFPVEISFAERFKGTY